MTSWTKKSLARYEHSEKFCFPDFLTIFSKTKNIVLIVFRVVIHLWQDWLKLWFKATDKLFLPEGEWYYQKEEEDNYFCIEKWQKVVVSFWKCLIFNCVVTIFVCSVESSWKDFLLFHHRLCRFFDGISLVPKKFAQTVSVFFPKRGGA